MTEDQAASLWTSSISRPLKSSVTKSNFHDALTVWIRKPHTVNRRLIGAKIIHESTLQSTSDCFVTISDNLAKLRTEKTVSELAQEVENLIVKESGNVDEVVVYVRDLVPKQLDRFHTARELIVKCKSILFFRVLYFVLFGILSPQLYVSSY